MSEHAARGSRALFIDSLRSLIILLVLVIHVAAGYGRQLPWWPVSDEAHIAFDVLARFLDLFIMPVMFFFAGYFTLPSLRKGIRSFLASKVARLALPFLFSLALIVPTMQYIDHFTDSRYADPRCRYNADVIPHCSPESPLYFENLETRSYLDYYREHFVPDLLELDIKPTDFFDLHIYHLWFISQLFIFFLLVSSAVFLLKTDPASISRSESPAGTASIVTSIAGVVVLSSVAFAVIDRFFYSDLLWLNIGNLLQVHPTRLMLQAGFFCLGIQAYRSRWFEGRMDLWRQRGWLLLWGSLLVLIIPFWQVMERTIELTIGGQALPAPPLSLSLSHGVLRSLLCVAIFSLLIALGIRLGDWSTPTTRRFAESSYGVYLVHFPIMVVMNLLLFTPITGAVINLPVAAEAMLILVVATVSSYWISNLVVNRNSKLGVLVLIVLNLALVIATTSIST